MYLLPILICCDLMFLQIILWDRQYCEHIPRFLCFSVDSGVKKEIRKRDRTLSPQSDVSTHDLYRQVQSGGDIPASGLQFPIPKRKGSYSVQSQPPLQHPWLLTSSFISAVLFFVFTFGYLYCKWYVGNALGYLGVSSFLWYDTMV